VYLTLVHSTPSVPLLSPFPPSPHYSTAFNTHPYVLYLHRCYALWYYWCASILFSFPSFPEFHSSSTITDMFYLWVSMWSRLFLCICLSFGSIFHIWEKKKVHFIYILYILYFIYIYMKMSEWSPLKCYIKKNSTCFEVKSADCHPLQRLFGCFFWSWGSNPDTCFTTF
jgi:hypothetical protein